MGKIIRIDKLHTTGYTRRYQYAGTTYHVASSFSISVDKGKAKKTLKQCVGSALLKESELTEPYPKATITSSTTLCPLERRSNADKE